MPDGVWPSLITDVSDDQEQAIINSSEKGLPPVSFVVDYKNMKIAKISDSESSNRMRYYLFDRFGKKSPSQNGLILFNCDETGRLSITPLEKPTLKNYIKCSPLPEAKSVLLF